MVAHGVDSMLICPGGFSGRLPTRTGGISTSRSAAFAPDDEPGERPGGESCALGVLPDGESWAAGGMVPDGESCALDEPGVLPEGESWAAGGGLPDGESCGLDGEACVPDVESCALDAPG